MLSVMFMDLAQDVKYIKDIYCAIMGFNYFVTAHFLAQMHQETQAGQVALTDLCRNGLRVTAIM